MAVDRILGILNFLGVGDQLFKEKDVPVIDKSRYVTNGQASINPVQEYLYGEMPGTNMQGTLYSPMANQYSDRDLRTNPMRQSLAPMSRDMERDMMEQTIIDRNNLQTLDTNRGTMTDGQVQTLSSDVVPTQTSVPTTPQVIEKSTYAPRDTNKMGLMGETPKIPYTEVEFENSEQGLLDTKEKESNSIWNYLTSQEGMATLGIAFNNMTLNPNPSIDKLLFKRLETIKARKDSNRTADEFRKMAEKETDPIKKQKLLDYAEGFDKGIIKDTSKAFIEIFSDKTSPFSLNLGDNKKYNEMVGKQVLDKKDQYQSEAVNNRGLLDAYTRMNDVFKNINWQTGLTEQFKQDLRNAVGGFPVLEQFVDKAQLGAGQELQAIVNQLVAGELRKNKGPQTDFDAEFQLRTMPNLGNTPEANQKLISYGTGVARISTLVGQIMRQADLKNPDKALEIQGLADTLRAEAPGVVKNKDGVSVTFEQFYNNPANANKTGIQRLVDWTNAANEMLNTGAPKINLEMLKIK